MFAKIKKKIKKFFINKTKLKTNKIIIINEKGQQKEIKKIKKLKVKFEGENSSLILYSPVIRFKDSSIVLGSNSKVEIKSSNRIANKLKIRANANNVFCLIEEGFSCHNGLDILLHKENNLKVLIGKDCMFGSNIKIRTSDAHTIVNKETKEIINYGKDVLIGNHVWVARDVSIFKGVKIADNSVVGACSIVTKSLEEANSLYVGSPAKKIKSDIEWHRESIPNYLEKQNG